MDFHKLLKNNLAIVTILFKSYICAAYYYIILEI